MKTLLIILCIPFCLSCNSSEKSKPEQYIIQNVELGNKLQYLVLNTQNDTVLKLDPDKYWMCFSDTVKSFLVVAPKDRKGWWAIDFDENYLFKVYNTSPGEPSPDEISFDRIRIVDETGKIGFADEKGNIIIKPRFKQAT